ncbi:uncharacterized protein [Antedon mediterranea]|uniref:uncharacterized protein n=1 Tax=Antedon mediterranea TaxID=105859 RepID=UPI003AF549D1
MADKRKKKTEIRKRNWSHAETHALIEIWGQKSHQEGFEGMKYNSRVWGSITRELLEAFPDCPYKTWESVRDRIEYLKKKYRAAKKLNNSSGRGRTTSPFYNEIDEILGRRPMNNVKAYHHMDADLSGSDEEVTVHVGEVSEPPNQAEPGSSGMELTGLDSTSLDEENRDSDTSFEVPPPENENPLLDGSLDEGPAKKKIKLKSTERKTEAKHDGSVFRKRRGKKSQMEDALDKSISKLIDYQQTQNNQTTNTLMEMERERLQWEKSLEEERKRNEAVREEREERRRQENNQFLLQLAGILGNAMQNFGSNSGGNTGGNHFPPNNYAPNNYAPNNYGPNNETPPTFWQDPRNM